MPPYFELKLELYSYLLTEPSTSAHAKLVKSISKAVGKTFSKPLRDQEIQVRLIFFYNQTGNQLEYSKLILSMKDATEIKRNKTKSGPQFDLLATATLRLNIEGNVIDPYWIYSC